MSNIKVSIVTVCYNSAKTIEQTIRSVLSQAYRNIEYIIIDGGSTDGTQDIIKKYEKNIDCWVSEPDYGIYDAMNKGIKKATGDVIGFMNSDDWYADGSIAAIAKAFERVDVDIVYGHTIFVDNGVQTFRPGPSLEQLKQMFTGMVFCHQSVFVKTELMKEKPFDISYRISADYAFLLEMYLQRKIFSPINTIIAYFRRGGESSHPWRTFQNMKRASLRLSKGKIDEEWEQKIREAFRKNRLGPLFSFLFPKIKNLSKEKKDKIAASLEKRCFVLYGAGKAGREILAVMKDLGLHAVAFWDSDVEKQGTETDGTPTLCPCEKNHQATNATILITTTTVKYNETIAGKLDGLGYERGKDFFGTEVLLGWMARAWLGWRVDIDENCDNLVRL